MNVLKARRRETQTAVINLYKVIKAKQVCKASDQLEQHSTCSNVCPSAPGGDNSRFNKMGRTEAALWEVTVKKRLVTAIPQVPISQPRHVLPFQLKANEPPLVTRGALRLPISQLHRLAPCKSARRVKLEKLKVRRLWKHRLNNRGIVSKVLPLHRAEPLADNGEEASAGLKAPEDPTLPASQVKNATRNTEQTLQQQADCSESLQG